MAIWQLVVLGNHFAGFAAGVGYSPEYEAGAAIDQTKWRIPDAKPVNVRKPMPDFASYLDGYPTVSARAKDLLVCHAPHAAEFLPFPVLKGAPFWLANVFQVADPGPEDQVPLLFKRPGRPIEIFANDQFGKMLIEHNLKGLGLIDENDQPLVMLIAGREMNKFPGLDPYPSVEVERQD